MIFFTKFDKTINSRDIIDRIDELESEIEDLEMDELEDLTGALMLDELEILQTLIDEIADARWGVTLIHEDFFEEYAEEFAMEIGAINRDMSWPANCIDWTKAARFLKIDYTEVDFDGETFYFC